MPGLSVLWDIGSIIFLHRNVKLLSRLTENEKEKPQPLTNSVPVWIATTLSVVLNSSKFLYYHFINGRMLTVLRIK